ncbi:uncharacterized protein LODBEIA_P58650 [Lodderomyces beijingensis]|uniref:Importin N-terminal domain-containing protein n=1 Tax=Lodderomyces beijingensis TaxID=1775926 RepID=A0ABP0ZW41_9ASCO
MVDLLQLIVDQTSSDNNLRRRAELEFNQVVAHEPSESLYLILELALNTALSTNIRQSCLLQLKRLVPKYWSLGFASFIGPPIAQDLKPVMRSKLLSLALDSADSKIRNGAAYAIVQIASVDYPDEWPDLMNELYAATTKSYRNSTRMLGALSVLTDLFDDLITEEQFWEGGVGDAVISHLNAILENAAVAIEVKNQAVKLYETVFAILAGPESFSTEERKQGVITQVSSTLKIFMALIQSEGGNLVEMDFKSNIYKAIASIIGQFHQRLSMEIKAQISLLTIQDLARVAPVFNKVALNEYDAPRFSAIQVFNNVIYYIFHTLSSIQHDVPISQVANMAEFVKNAIVCAALPKDVAEEYADDLGLYVSEITGLSVEINPRDAILDFWGDLNQSGLQAASALITQSFSSDGRILEAELFTLEGIFSSDAELPTVPLQDLLSFVSYDGSLVTARCFLLLPKYFEKYGDGEAIKVFSDMIVFAEKAEKIIQIAALVSCTYYQHVFEFSQLDHSIQAAIFKVVYHLIGDCEEDGLAVLIEAITVAISINPALAASVEIVPSISLIDVVFQIAFKDPANVQLISDASDCLSTLLESINEHDYLLACEKSLPHIIKTMQQCDGEYSPQLYLSLEFLGIVIKSSPGTLPARIFSYVFPALEAVLLKSTDNQILQSGGEVFDELLGKGSSLFVEYKDPQTKESGMESIMKIVAKFLSPELSDSAANKCGSIVSSIISHFQNQIPAQILTQILEATVNRLVLAKEPVTIENLIMAFCKLVLLSPEQTVNFLSSMTINGKSGLETVLPIWFESYQVTRGFEPIKQNSLALAKIFTLGDARVENLVVNGEIIPYEGNKIITRSMAKSMPERYTQTSASLKIIKLLVTELQFQCQQPDASDYLPLEDFEDGKTGEDDAWEDMDDIGVPNYDKLKSYVDEDQASAERSSGGGTGGSGDDSLKQLLIQFFKECTAKNLGNFRKYYEQLTAEEKKLISECLIF